MLTAVFTSEKLQLYFPVAERIPPNISSGFAPFSKTRLGPILQLYAGANSY